MTGVGVLAAIKNAALALPVSHEVRATHHALCDAGAAVAELIDAAGEAVHFIADTEYAQSVERRLEAALARVGGAK